MGNAVNAAASLLDLDTMRQRWRRRGFSCDVWRDPPGQVWADFVHDTDELVMLVDGSLEIRMNGDTLPARIGEEILIPAGVSHTVRNTGNTTNSWFYGYRSR